MRRILVLAPVLACICLLLALPASAETASRPVFGKTNLSFIRADGKFFSFKVETALSPEQQAYGLMFVKNLPENEGMLFPYHPAQEVAFWMKNTLIPLDLVFVRENGTIGRIAAQARPLDLTPIPSAMPVIAVIEIAGGMAQKDGLEVGDKVVFSGPTPAPR